MTHPFSLLAARWLPVRRAAVSRIAPHEITQNHDDDPVMDFAWPRPDFDIAAHEFMIGLLAAAFPPKSPRDWLRLYRTPPSPDELAAAFAPYADAFLFDDEGPRFLQDFSPLEGEGSPVEALFIEAPGANTVKLNKDLLVKRGRVKTLSRASAAMALYALQQFAPSGGQGHRTSLRGGGPLTTLVLPGPDADGRPASLWRKLWLHVPVAAALPSDRFGETRRACRDAFRKSKLLERLIPGVEEMLAAGGLSPPEEPPEAMPVAFNDPGSLGDAGHRG